MIEIVKNLKGFRSEYAWLLILFRREGIQNASEFDDPRILKSSLL